MSRMELAERRPETCRVEIPIKLQFSASVGFIHKIVNCVSEHHNTSLSLPCDYLFILVNVFV
jgi:hypothetical protein